MKRLIVNADDFGLTGGVNRAIALCHERGIVTSTTLMATGARLNEAVEMARQMPTLGVGCHVVLVDGEPILPAEEVRSLLAPGTNRFYHTIGEVLQAVTRGQFRASEVTAEASAQMRRLREAGVTLSHFDAHKHTHMFPSLLRPILRAAEANGVRRVRNPFEAPGVVGWGEALGQRQLLVRKFETTVLRALLYRGWRRAVQEAGFITTDGSLGVATTGSLDRPSLEAMLAKMPDGLWELVCHPGYNDNELDAVRTKLRASREIELSALTAFGRDALRQRFSAEAISFEGL